MVRCLCAREWGIRSQAIAQVTARMSQRHRGTVEGLVTGKFPIFSAALSVVCHSADDRVVNVFESGLALLHCAVEEYLPTLTGVSSG